MNDVGAAGVKENDGSLQPFLPPLTMREDLEDITECLRGHDHIKAAWIFGSLAQGDGRPSSDLDVAVLGEEPLPAAEKERLIERLARVSGRPVDLIDLRNTRGPIVGRVLQGTRLFCDDTTLYAELIKRWWYDQADWVPYRRRILKDRRERWIGN